MIKNRIHNRLFELDALRGIAALAVVLFHFTYAAEKTTSISNPNKFYFSYGYLGVHLFFLISGFVIFMTLEKTKKPLDFVVSRFSRLYPAYWAAIFTTLIITTFIFNNYEYTLKQILVNLTMFQYWFKVKDIDGAYWTLAVELTFYVIMWFLYISKQLKNIFYFSILWLFLCLTFALYEIPFENYINILLILRYAPLFIAGVAFYSLKSGNERFKNHLIVILSYLTICVPNFINKPNSTVWIIITAFFVIFYLFVFNKLNFLNNRILLFLGSISYSLYLIHESVGISIILHLKKYIDSQLFYLPFTTILVILMATIINKYIEKPVMNFIRSKYKNYAK